MTFVGPNRELKLQGKPPPLKSEETDNQVQRITAGLFLPGTEAIGP